MRSPFSPLASPSSLTLLPSSSVPPLAQIPPRDLYTSVYITDFRALSRTGSDHRSRASTVGPAPASRTSPDRNVTIRSQPQSREGGGDAGGRKDISRPASVSGAIRVGARAESGTGSEPSRRRLASEGDDGSAAALWQGAGGAARGTVAADLVRSVNIRPQSALGSLRSAEHSVAGSTVASNHGGVGAHRQAPWGDVPPDARPKVLVPRLKILGAGGRPASAASNATRDTWMTSFSEFSGYESSLVSTTRFP